MGMRPGLAPSPLLKFLDEVTKFRKQELSQYAHSCISFAVAVATTRADCIWFARELFPITKLVEGSS